MYRSQVVADLTIQLAAVTTIERATEVMRRALRAAGLSRATTISETEMTELLQAIAAEGGAIQQLAEEIAVDGLPREGTLPTDQNAA